MVSRPTALPDGSLPHASSSGALTAVALEVVPRLSRLVYRTLAGMDPPLTVRQFRVLARLGSGAAEAIGALAERSGVRVPSMSQTVESLVERGWARRDEDPSDRRRRTIQVTDAGLQALRDAETAVAAELADLLAGLSADEARALGTGFAALRRELDGRWNRRVGGEDD